MKYVAIFVFVAALSVVLAVPVPALQELDIQLDPPQMICKQHIKRGSCRALIPRWMYDVKRGVCLEFKYGGCGGNANNFETQGECEFVCNGVRL